MLHPLEIPEWKWDCIAVDFVSGLPRTSTGHDAIWVVVDQLTKSAHFLPISIKSPLEKLTQMYVKEIVRLHGVPSSIVSIEIQDTCQDSGEVYIKPCELKSNLARHITLKRMVSPRGQYKPWKTC